MVKLGLGSDQRRQGGVDIGDQGDGGETDGDALEIRQVGGLLGRLCTLVDGVEEGGGFGDDGEGPQGPAIPTADRVGELEGGVLDGGDGIGDGGPVGEDGTRPEEKSGEEGGEKLHARGWHAAAAAAAVWVKVKSGSPRCIIAFGMWH